MDAIYFPLPTGLRREWVVRAAEAGKHVLCEKPCAPSAADLEAMLSACRKNRVQFMDGVMFMHNPRLGQIRAALDDGASTGPLKRITSHFSFPGSEDFFRADIRVNGALEPAGCLGDLGWYCIRFALWTMKWQMPARVEGRIISRAGNQPAGVPLEFSGELFFGGGVSSGFYCSFLTAYRQWADISGAKGYLRVPDFVAPEPGSENVFEVKSSCGQIRPFRRRAGRRAGNKHDPQFHEPDFFRQAQRRLADVGAENAASHGRLFGIGAARRGRYIVNRCIVASCPTRADSTIQRFNDSTIQRFTI